MNYRPIGHMQKQFSSISETVQSSQNSSNSCTVQSLQYRFNTKLMSVRQIRHPRPSSRTRSAHVEQNRWCPHGTSAIRGLRCAIRHTSQLSLSVSGVSTWLSVWLSMSTTSAWSESSSSTSELSSSASQPVAVSTDTVTYRPQELQTSIGTAVVPSTLNMPSSVVSKCRITLKWKQKKADFNRQKKPYYATKIAIFTEQSKICFVIYYAAVLNDVHISHHTFALNMQLDKHFNSN